MFPSLSAIVTAEVEQPEIPDKIVVHVHVCQLHVSNFLTEQLLFSGKHPSTITPRRMILVLKFSIGELSLFTGGGGANPEIAHTQISHPSVVANDVFASTSKAVH